MTYPFSPPTAKFYNLKELLLSMGVEDVRDDEESEVVDEEREEVANEAREGVAQIDLACVEIPEVEKDAEVAGADVGQTLNIPTEGTSDVPAT